MAIQSPHLNYFPSQIIQNREIMNNVVNKGNIYNNIDFGLPLSGITTTTTNDSLLPFYNNNNSAFVDWIPETFETTTTTMKAESGVTYNNLSSSAARKRSRDSFSSNPLLDYYGSRKLCRNNNNSVSFLGEDISLQIQQQQFEMDRLITQHMEKVRLMVAERRKEHSRRLIAIIEERIMKNLKAKEEEMDKIAKLNWVLEERVKSLCLENQMWRNLAETNEATANALRSNLEQVLSHQINNAEQEAAGVGVVAEDAESCCGSSDEGVGADLRDNKNSGSSDETNKKSDSKSRWWCRKCGKEESSVVLLPCRHLCLCRFCAPTLHKCPICDSNKNGSVHVHVS
ncbi:Boi-related e3 ubiquitin-protein ligase [Thalictrum thalictroides]|uniref:Boi-related e3 ubiquitin-protein ligase n=1 Tax=Thalictrum thalictroides TaxID=46969 RepID=A0A7J6WVI0_THATH|nr:Boi-related e3 ubiquitin-protein ligase [Thalictrum thalictroides]